MGIPSSLIVKSTIPGRNAALYGFDPVVDEAARAAITITANNIGKLIEQTGGIDPGRFISAAFGTGLDKWIRFDTHYGPWSASPTFKTPTGDGTVLEVGRVYLMGATGFGDPGNPDYFLPDGNGPTPPRKGERLSVLYVMSGSPSTEIATLACQGTDTILVTQTEDTIQGGGDDVFRHYIFLGDFGFGNPLWMIIQDDVFIQGSPLSGANPDNNGLILHADVMTEVPLPAYTVQGDGTAGDPTILTAVVNEPLVINPFNTPGVDSIVCVASELGVNRTYHGPYRLTQQGIADPGGQPWILEVLPQWAAGGATWRSGAFIFIDGAGGDANQLGTMISFFGKSDTTAGGGAEKDAIRTTNPNRVKVVQYVSTLPLPAYTASGTGHGLELTGVANGPFIINGYLSPGGGERVGVVGEIAGATQYNGVYTVKQFGSATEPYILSVAWDWAGHSQHPWGAIIVGTEDNSTRDRGTAWVRGRDAGDEGAAPINRALIPEHHNGSTRTVQGARFQSVMLRGESDNTVNFPADPFDGDRFGVRVVAEIDLFEPGAQTLVPAPGHSIVPTFTLRKEAGGWWVEFMFDNSVPGWRVDRYGGIDLAAVLGRKLRRSFSTTDGSSFFVFVYTTQTNSRVYAVSFEVIARIAGTDSLRIRKEAIVRRDGTGTLTVDATTTLIDVSTAGLAAADAAIQIGGSDIACQITGIAATNIEWEVIEASVKGKDD